MSITAVEVEPITGDIKPEIAIISSLTFISSKGRELRGNYVLVRVRDDSGRVGLGEATVDPVWSGETQAGTIALIREVLTPIVVGADPFDTEWISHRFDRAVFGNSFGKGAIEMALLDLQGQILGVPAYRLLGGKATPSALASGVRGEDRGIRLKFVVGAVE